MHTHRPHTLNIMKINKSKRKVLQMGIARPTHQYMLGTKLLESSVAEKALMVLVNTKLNVSQQMCPCDKIGEHVLHCNRRSAGSRLKEVILALFSALVRPGLLCPVLGYSVQERRGICL